HFVWLNKEVAWTWDVIYPLEKRFLSVLGQYKQAAQSDDRLRAILEQAARELLLMESSDWQFLISTKGAIQYSTDRFNEHAGYLTQLLDMADRYIDNFGLTE